MKIAFYFSEEILSTVDCDRELVVCDRATLFNMLIGLEVIVTVIATGFDKESKQKQEAMQQPIAQPQQPNRRTGGTRSDYVYQPETLGDDEPTPTPSRNDDLDFPSFLRENNF